MAKKVQSLPETNTIQKPEDFKLFLENLENFLKQTENNDSISPNFQLLCSVIEALKESPFQDFKSIFAQLAQSINAQRLEKIAIENKIKQLEKEDERLANVLEVRKEKIKEIDIKTANSIKDAELVYQDRLEGLTALDANLKRKEKSITEKLNQIERAKTEILLAKQNSNEELSKINKEVEANKNYLNVITREKVVLRKQQEDAENAANKLKQEQDKFRKNGEEVRAALDELQKTKSSLELRDKETVKRIEESRRIIEESIAAKNSVQKQTAEIGIKEKELEKKEASIKGLLGSIKAVGDRLEKRYGISHLVNFAEEKQAIIDDSNRTQLLQAAFNAVLLQARKKGWSPKEIEVPVLTATGGDEYISSLLK